MNIAKNMEAIFVVVIGLISATSFATASAPAADHVRATAAPAATMQVVTVSAKRMSAAEKAATAQEAGMLQQILVVYVQVNLLHSKQE